MLHDDRAEMTEYLRKCLAEPRLAQHAIVADLSARLRVMNATDAELGARVRVLLAALEAAKTPDA